MRLGSVVIVMYVERTVFNGQNGSVADSLTSKVVRTVDGLATQEPVDTEDVLSAGPARG